MRTLGSAPVPELAESDHLRGEAGPVWIVYGDYECPFCAALERRLTALPVRTVFRHFPVASSHPRALPAAAAAEAAAEQSAFWPMHDSLMADPARLEDPHLWARAEALGLDLARFEADRRGETVARRIREQHRGAIRAGVMGTPTLITPTQRHTGRIGDERLDRLLAG